MLVVFDAPFPLVVLGAGAMGIAVAAWRPAWLALKSDGKAVALGPRPWRHSISTILLWAAIWAAPMIGVLLALGPDHVLWRIGLFFSKLAVVTFGGAYAVLAYMAQQAVDNYGWLAPGEMANGLGLAETTPGPLIMVTQFVGYLAAFRAPAPFSPVMAGMLGAALTTWVTFAPCFMWIFAFAPWIERLQHARRLKGGLAAVTAAVVGVIGNLTLWFALHVLFGKVVVRDIGPAHVAIPDFASLDAAALGLALFAGFALFRLRWGILPVLAACAAAGFALAGV